MVNEKKFLDQAGVQYLWSQLSLEDYPNNETLIAALNAIDYTKADRSELSNKLDKDEAFDGSWNSLIDKPFGEEEDKETVFTGIPSWEELTDDEYELDNYKAFYTIDPPLHFIVGDIYRLESNSFLPEGEEGINYSAPMPIVETVCNSETQLVFGDLPNTGGGSLVVECQDTEVIFSSAGLAGNVVLIHVTPAIKQLDEKYIPDTISRTNHVHSWDELENKPFEIIQEGIDLAWDGTNTNIETVVPADYDNFYLVSELTFSNESLMNATFSEHTSSQGTMLWHFIDNDEPKIYFTEPEYNDDYFLAHGILMEFCVIRKENLEVNGLIFPKKGIYFKSDAMQNNAGQWVVFNYIASLTISGEYKYLDDRVLPDSIPRMKDVMKSINPVGTGSFSMNRREGTTIGDYSHAEGLRTTASGSASHAEGCDTQASGTHSHAEGCDTSATGSSISIQTTNVTTKGYATHAEGYGTVAYGAFSHAEGHGTKSSGLQSHAEGYKTVAQGHSSHAEGYGTRAYGDYSHAENAGTQAQGDYSHAEGYDTRANGDYGSHAEGNKAIASGQGSHAEGRETIAAGHASHAEGYNTQVTSDSTIEPTWNASIEPGWGGHAEGYGTVAYGAFSHAEGSGTYASGYYSHSEGYGATARGPFSHAQGNFTVASGSGSSAEGIRTTASGDYSHAEGSYTGASGDYSHAEGANSYALGENSHAEGEQSGAYGKNSHTEGEDTIAIGKNSHAEGFGGDTHLITLTGDAGATVYSYSFDGDNALINTSCMIVNTRTGEFARVISKDSNTITLDRTLSDTALSESYYSISQMAAIGDCSHIEGEGTIAGSKHQHVQGRYNIEDADEKYAHIVGNGALQRRSNAHTVDWQGNAWFQGDVYVGSINGTNKDEGSVKLLKESNIATDDDIMEMLAEINIIEPLTTSDGSIYTNKNGDIYTL